MKTYFVVERLNSQRLLKPNRKIIVRIGQFESDRHVKVKKKIKNKTKTYQLPTVACDWAD